MIGIITAIDDEYNAIKNLIKIEKEEIIAKMNFSKGQINDKLVILGKCGQGKVNAACCTQLMIDRFNVNYIINVGIGGALSPELSIGQIVISEDAIQYDMDGTGEGCQRGEIPDMGKINFIADAKMIKLSEEAAIKFNIPYKVGRVLSADLFLDDSDKKEQIVEEFQGILCEMEGAAIGHVCYLNSIPYVIIRSVSDTASNHANDQAMFNMNNVVSNSTKIVENLVNNL